MRLAQAFIFLLSGGFLLSFGWIVAALLCAPVQATRPLATVSLQMARLCLWPGDKELIRDAEIANYRDYIRTGRHEKSGASIGIAHLGLALLWLPIGIVLLCGHLLHGVIMAAPVFANPWEPRSGRLVRAAVFPLGISVAPSHQARAVRFTGNSRRSLPFARLLNLGSRLALACRHMAKPVARASGAGLIFWATPSAYEVSPRSSTVAFDAQQLFGLRRAPYPYAEQATPHRSSPYRVRPEANSPLPVEPAAALTGPLTRVHDDCLAPEVRVAVAKLSRRHTEFGALPLGSPQIQMGYTDGRAQAAERVLKVQEWIGPVRQAKSPGPLCLEAMRYRIARGTSFAAEIALADRLTRKASPDGWMRAGGPLTHVGPGAGHLVAPRHLAGFREWTGVAMHGKAAHLRLPRGTGRDAFGTRFR